MSQTVPTGRTHLRGRAPRPGRVGDRPRASSARGFTNLLTASREQLDLRDQAAVNYWFRAHRPEYVYLVAGTVGGILANSTRPAEFIYDNMMIHATVVHASYVHDVKKLLYLGSSCIYPRDAAPADDRRGAAHRSARADERGLRDREDRRHQAVPVVPRASTAPTSSPRCRRTSTARTTTSTCTSSHVLPALMRKFHDAKVERSHASVEIWGTGTPAARVPPRRRPRRRVPVPDGQLRRASSTSTSAPASTSASASSPRLVRDVVYPEAELVFDTTQARRHAAQAARRRAASTHLGWKASIELREGIESTYAWFLEHQRVLAGTPDAELRVTCAPSDAALERAHRPPRRWPRQHPTPPPADSSRHRHALRGRARPLGLHRGLAPRRQPPDGAPRRSHPSSPGVRCVAAPEHHPRAPRLPRPRARQRARHDRRDRVPSGDEGRRSIHRYVSSADVSAARRRGDARCRAGGSW